MITETDDFFCHQLAEPHAVILLNDPSFSDRAFFTVSDPERFGMDIGMSMYPNNDTMESYAIIVQGVDQTSLRASRNLSGGRWPLQAGPIRLDVVDPMRHWHLTCEENESGISFELDFCARAAPYEGRSPTIRRRGRLVYDNVNMFQAGRWHGEIRLHGMRLPVDGIPGHRDRTWGVRASGEGRVPRGLLTWLSAEFDDVSVMALIHERHNGTPVMRMGAVSHEGGDVIEIVDYQHDITFDYDSRQLQHARFSLLDAEGRRWEVEAEPSQRLHLAGGGYTSGETRRGQLGAAFWTERWDLSDPVIVRRHDGLCDNISRMRCGERTGHGIVETLIGEHDRYRVAPLT